MSRILEFLLISYISIQIIVGAVFTIGIRFEMENFDGLGATFSFITFWSILKDNFYTPGCIIIMVFLLPVLIWGTLFDVLMIICRIIGKVFCILFERKDIE